MKVYKYKRRYRGRVMYHIKWLVDGVWVSRSTGCRRATDAERVRADAERDLERALHRERYGFDEVVERYVDEVLAGTGSANQNKYWSAVNNLKRFQDPAVVDDIDTDCIAEWVRKMRDDSLSEATISNYLTYVKRFVEWCAKPQIGLTRMAPLITKPKLPQERSKGRPITLEEFERMRDKAAVVVGQAAAPSFERLLDGLWLSGLRLGEALRLHWRRENAKQIVVLPGGTGFKLEIPAVGQKRRKFELYVPHEDFQVFLGRVCPSMRHGAVFNPLNRDGNRHGRSDTVGKLISDMGQRAGIVVEYDDKGPVKYASQKDLRASFAMRMIVRGVHPRKLQLLMRHSSIETTMKYYATLDPDSYDPVPRAANSVAKDPDWQIAD